MDLEWMEDEDDDEQEEEKETEKERSRPTTPKWWRPPIPPETYMWEEIRRKRKKGGYPWTLLDKDDELYGEDDNLYEPVNPPPLYGSGSRYMSKDQTDTGSLDGRMLDIPPDIEILTSEGLDGLDQPDPHDKGVDGDKEWHHFHHEDEQGQPVKATFTAGLRKEKRPKHRSKAEGSNMRPLTNKNITFAPESNPGVPVEEGAAQEVPTAEPGPSHRVGPLDQLKAKAEQAAGQVKQRISKISIPVRPKFNNWTGIKLAKKKPKEKRKAEDVGQEMEEEDQTVPDEEAFSQEPLAKRKLEEIEAPIIESVPEPEVVEVQQEQSAKQEAADKAALKAEEKAKKDKEAAEEKARKEKEKAEEKARLAEEKAKKDKEHAEEKARKEKEQAEEKARKDKEAEEIKKAKAEEKAAKEKAKEEQKRLKAEEKLQKQEEAKKAKLEAELKKAAELEEQKRLKAEEDEMKALQDEEDRRVREAEEGDVEMEDPEGHDITPGGTRSRRPKKKMYRPNMPQLPHLPQLPNLPTLPQIDLKKRFIRHKSPESRPSPTRAKKRMGLENLLGIQYSDELRSRDLEMEEEQGDRLREPKIFVTQASVETESEVPTDYSRTGASVRSDEFEEEIDEALPVSKQAQAQEKLEKIGKQLKGFGIKSKAIASQKSKDLGQKMKVLGKDIQKFGVKVNEKCHATIEEIKAKQEAARNKKKDAEGYEGEGEEGEMDLEVEGREVLEDMEDTEPRTTFRFRRRTEEQIEQEKKSSSQGVDLNFYENDTPAETQAGVEEDGDGKFARCQLLGRADRDWESPLDLAQSRDASEEPFSGNVSSRDSPPGSSMASSSIMQVRRQGVLEEIDSDEFFLRERGISEGEDEEEVNRFLVEELRQAFRPTMANALAGFDLPAPPSRPTRTPRKPPRKQEKDRGSPNFQTFPPERPRRKQTPGYVSSYMNEHGDEEDEESAQRDEEIEEEVVEKVTKEIAEDRNREILEPEDEDEGSYEPVSDEPAKPERTKRKKPKVPETNQAFYYNTIAANEWMREVEEQILDTELEQLEIQQHTPAAPKRERRRSERSTNVGESDTNLADEDSRQESTLREDEGKLTQAESEGKMNESEVDLDDTLDYVDEAGYAIVHKDKEPPRTTPRKKKRGSNGGGSKGNSLKRKDQQSDTSGSGPLFFSLPRYTPRTFHIVPPTRPHRTYSTLRPKRPPRNKSKSNQNLVQSNSNTPTSSRRDRDSEEPRPSTAIGIMQGRPLPPPPRPERSPAPLNDLDQTSIERAVGVRHYANFEDESGQREVVEEVFTATNIPMLGRNREEEETEVSSLLANSDINVAVQTDPVQGDDYELNNVTSFEEEDSSRVDKLRNSESRIPSDDQGEELPEDRPPLLPSREVVSTEAEVPITLKLQPTPDPERETNLQPATTEPTSIEPTIPAPVEPVQPPQIAPTPTPAPPEPAPIAAPVIQAPPPTITPAPTIIQAPAPIQAPPEPAPAPPQPQPPPAPIMMQPQFIFPTRLHLEELEVDVLRVIDLSAHSITVDHLQAPHLEVTSLTSSGPLTVDRIQAQTLNSDQVNCNNLSSDTVDLPSIPPPSFYQLASPESVVPEERAAPQELNLETGEQEDNENECSCPEDIIIGQLSLRSAEELLASLTSARRETVVETSTRNIPVEEELVEEEHAPSNLSFEPDSLEPLDSLEPFDSLEPIESVQSGATSLDESEIVETVSPVSASPREITPVRSVPREITPVRSAPREITPVRSAPREITPVRIVAREITPVRSVQQESVTPVRSAPPVVSGQPESNVPSIPSLPTAPARRSISSAPIAAAAAENVDSENEDIIQLSTRLCRALVKATVRALQAMADYIDVATSDDPSKAEEQRANMQVLLCIVLVLVAGMILTTRSGPPTPKWEFYMPPPDL